MYLIHVSFYPFIAFIPAVAIEELAAVVYYRPVLVQGEADARCVKPFHCVYVLGSRGTF